MTITPKPGSWEQFYDLEPLDPPPDPMATPEPDPEPEPDYRVTLEDGTSFYVYGSGKNIAVERVDGLIHFTLTDPETGRSIVALTHDYAARRLARDILTETERPR